MVELLLLAFIKLFEDMSAKGKASQKAKRQPRGLSTEDCFFLDEIDKDIKDQDVDAPITNEDFYDGPEW